MKETILKHHERALKQVRNDHAEIADNLQRQISNLLIMISNQGARIAKLEKALDK